MSYRNIIVVVLVSCMVAIAWSAPASEDKKEKLETANSYGLGYNGIYNGIYTGGYGALAYPNYGGYSHGGYGGHYGGYGGYPYNAYTLGYGGYGGYGGYNTGAGYYGGIYA